MPMTEIRGAYAGNDAAQEESRREKDIEIENERKRRCAEEARRDEFMESVAKEKDIQGLEKELARLLQQIAGAIMCMHANLLPRGGGSMCVRVRQPFPEVADGRVYSAARDTVRDSPIVRTDTCRIKHCRGQTRRRKSDMQRTGETRPTGGRCSRSREQTLGRLLPSLHP